MILVIALGAQAAAFTSKMGRAIVCTDSYQYVAAAEDMLDGAKTAPFEMRKPGYPLLLAGVWMVAGRSIWSAVVANHLMLAMLPLAGYGFGVLLRSRWVGWLAAILLVARLQMAFARRSEDIGNWIMSETLYAFLLSFGLFMFFWALQQRKAFGRLIVAGALLGLAWLTRGVATPVILIALLALLVLHRGAWRLALHAVLAFVMPIVACVLAECALNQHTGGAFRPSKGTSGSCLWSYRLRAFEGPAPALSEEARQLVSLLPERTATDAFVADPKDQWVAIARAHRRHGIGYAEFDDLCLRAAYHVIAADPWTCALHSVKLAAYHLSRLPAPGMDLSPLPHPPRGDPITNSLPLAATNPGDPCAAWSLPSLPAAQSYAVVASLRKEGNQPAPFTKSGIWSVLAYWRSKPVIVTVSDSLAKTSLIWPGFAILLCPWLGLNRKICWTMAAIYVADAVALSLVTVTDARYQSVWVVTDTVFAATLPCVALAKIRAWRLLTATPFAAARKPRCQSAA